MSRLRAKCPGCRTLTAVALGPDYECHSCGSVFRAGLVRVPRAWGSGGDAMVDAAWLPLPYPEVAVVEEPSVGEQNLAIAAELPMRPLVLGGCCVSHAGAVEGLAARHDRLGLIWIDAHGDLNTPETSPSGNVWGMPLRMLIDAGTVELDCVALVGARALDEPEHAFIAASGIQTGEGAAERVIEKVDCVYVALDADALDARDVASFMPEPAGIPLDEAERLLVHVAERATVVGAGFSGLAPDERNVAPLARLAVALGL